MVTTTSPTLPEHFALLTRDDAAAFTRCDVSTVDRWIASGHLPHIRLGSRVLIRRAALRAYTDPHTARRALAEPVADDALVTIPEAAALLRVSPGSVKRWTTSGRLHVVRLGRGVRIRLADVADLIDAQSVAATSGHLTGRTV